MKSTRFEYFMMESSMIYLIFFMVLPSVYFTIKKLQKVDFPKILKKQLTTLIQYFILPYIFIEFIHCICFINRYYFYAEDSLSALIFTLAIYYAMRKVMGLRFLNFQNHVRASRSFNFIDDFKNVLETVKPY